MTTKILNEQPPGGLCEMIRNAGMRYDPARTIFTYGDTIYNPACLDIPADLVAHEEVHVSQQKKAMIYHRHPFSCHTWSDLGGMECSCGAEEKNRQELLASADIWWAQYLQDPLFRIQQEAEAYGRQYSFFCSRKKSRDVQLRMLGTFGYILAGPTYGEMITPEGAIKMIQEYAATM